MASTPPRRVLLAVLGARAALRRIADRPLPAHMAVFDRMTGLARTHVIGTFAELGVADAIAAAGSARVGAGTLAPVLGVDDDTLHRLLRAAAIEDLVRMDRHGRVRLTRTGHALRSDHPDSMRDWARYLVSPATTAAWAGLPESVRTGESAYRRVNGESVWARFATHSEEERHFAAGMRRLTELDAPWIATAYPWPAAGTVCDIAGGAGTLLARILQAHDGLRGVLVDGAGVIEEARRHLEAEGVLARTELVVGDLFGEIHADADVFVLKNILHDWDDAACARILGVVAATMPAGARLVLVEQIQERNRPHPAATLTDLQMLTQCEDGRERSVAELQALLRGAGLAPGRVIRGPVSGLVEGIAGARAA